MHTRVVTDKGETGRAFASDDRIFLGEGLFETLRVERSIPCSSYLHWQRMQEGAKTLGIPFDLSFDDWQEQLVQQIKRDNLYHGGIKVILSGGSAPRGLAEHGQVSQLLFHSFNYTLENAPLRLLSASWLRDASNPVYQLKSVNYLEAIIARRQALAKGYDDILFFNTKHHATATTCANFFIINNGALHTPALSDGVLSGVTRRRILTHCEQHKISCFEGSISKTLIREADSVFVTNSLQGIRLVKSVDAFDFEIDHPLIQQLNSLLDHD